MSCFTNKFNCKNSKYYLSLQDKFTNLVKENDKLKNKNISLKRQIDVFQTYRLMFTDLPTIEELLKSGQAKKVTAADIKRKIQKQFGMKLKMSDSNSLEWGKTSIRWVEEGYANIRLPWWIVKKILDRSPINFFPYENKEYICNDFAKSLNCVINLGPYWQAVWGIIRIKGHRVNLVWLSDYDDMIYVEPQNDQVWLPDMKNEKDIPRELIL